MIRVVEGTLVGAGRLGILPAAFNPPTIAHVALAEAAREQFALDQVAFVLPHTLPHKRLDHEDFDRRLRWVASLTENQGAWLAASAEQGLVVEIVREFREQVSDSVEIFVISGRDAAERFVAWDYGDAASFDEQLRYFQLLVGSRNGAYRVALRHSTRIHSFAISTKFDRVSATAVRDQLDLNTVPETIRDSVEKAFVGGLK